MLPILDRDTQRVAFSVEVSDYRFNFPITIFIYDISPIAIF
jgi:hypothetical protein